MPDKGKCNLTPNCNHLPTSQARLDGTKTEKGCRNVNIFNMYSNEEYSLVKTPCQYTITDMSTDMLHITPTYD